jgi:hypothetical protein
MFRSLFAMALLAQGGLAMAQPGANPANPFDQAAARRGGTTTLPRTIANLRSPISQAEEAALLRHYEKMLDMKLEMELQLDFAQVNKGAENPEVDQIKKRLEVLAKRLTTTKTQIEEKTKVRQDELLKQQQLQMQQIQQQQLQMQQMQQRRNEEGRNNFNAPADDRRMERISLKRVAADDVVRAVQAFATKNQKKIQNLSIQTEARGNSIVLFGTDSDLKAAKEVIQDLDKAPKDEKEAEKPK